MVYLPAQPLESHSCKDPFAQPQPVGEAMFYHFNTLSSLLRYFTSAKCKLLNADFPHPYCFAAICASQHWKPELFTSLLGMDVVGSGASVLAFVGIALQSTKAVFQVVSAIKNGSAKVKHLLSATEDLANVLQQIECSLNASNIGQDLDTREIHRLVAKCASDLSAIATDVKRLREIPSEAGIRKGFKRVKIMLKKDEFAEMSTIVSHHFHAIQMQMSLLHR